MMGSAPDTAPCAPSASARRHHGRQNLAVAESFMPMTDAERLALFRDIMPLVRPDKLPWKATDWDHPTEWVPRNRGRA
jgi:hypothetical protein